MDWLTRYEHHHYNHLCIISCSSLYVICSPPFRHLWFCLAHSGWRSRGAILHPSMFRERRGLKRGWQLSTKPSHLPWRLDLGHLYPITCFIPNHVQIVYMVVLSTAIVHDYTCFCTEERGSNQTTGTPGNMGLPGLNSFISFWFWIKQWELGKILY